MSILANKWGILLLLLITAAAFGPQQETGSLAGVSGRVTSSATGAPIRHAHVRLYGARQTYGALTGSDGKFSISRLPGGRYMLYVDALGFQPPPTFYDPPPNRLVLQPSEHKDDLDIALVPFAAISGRVIDAEGRSMQGVAISVLSVEGVTEGGISDPDGLYRVGNLPPGKYRVQADPATSGNLPPEIRSDGTIEVHYSPTYYPSSLTIGSAGRLNLPPGAERTGIDIRLVRTPIVAVRGKISGIPANDDSLSITVRKMEPPLVQGKSVRRMFADQRRVNPDGSFVLWRLDPGSYILTAQSYRHGWASAPIEINVADQDIEGIELRLIQQLDVSGRILHDDDGARLPQVPANASLIQTPQISLEGHMSNTSAFSTVAPDGSFHFDRVLPDQYSVHLFWGEHLPYVKSMRLGSTKIDGSMLNLRNGSEGATLTVMASSARGQISGVVRKAAGPAAYARVAFLPEGEGFRSDLFVVSARSDGTYGQAYLAPGKYQIVALDAGVAHARALRYHLEDSEDIIKTFEVHPGDRLTLDLRQH